MPKYKNSRRSEKLDNKSKKNNGNRRPCKHDFTGRKGQETCSKCGTSKTKVKEIPECPGIKIS